MCGTLHDSHPLPFSVGLGRFLREALAYFASLSWDGHSSTLLSLLDPTVLQTLLCFFFQNLSAYNTRLFKVVGQEGKSHYEVRLASVLNTGALRP